MRHFSSVEILEDRIAPATLVNPMTVTYQDSDGDNVVVKLSKGLFTSSSVANQILTFSTGSVNNDGNATAQSLSTINLEGISGAQGVDISVTVQPKVGSTGDGQANVGAVIAGSYIGNGRFDHNIDLGVINIQGDLGQIVCGDDFNTPAIKSLTVNNFGISHSSSGDQLQASSVLGPITNLHVTGDFVGVLDMWGFQFGSIGTLTIDGTLKGSSSDTSNSTGAIVFTGTIGSATINKIQGGAASQSGILLGSASSTVPANINKLHIGTGGIVGGSGASSGEVFASTIGSVQVDGDLAGGTGSTSGAIIATKIGATQISGSVVGNSGANSGVLQGSGSLGSVKIGGAVTGGGGKQSGWISFGGATQSSLTIGGDLTGGTGIDSGEILGSSFKNITLGNIVGGTAQPSGIVSASGSVGAISVGNIVGAGAANSGELFIGNTLGSLQINGSVIGGAGKNSGYVLTGHLGSANVFGSLVGGAGDSSGQIWGSLGLGNVHITGSIIGGAGEQSGLLYSGGSGAQPGVTVDGNVQGGSKSYSGVIFGNASFKNIAVHGSLIGSTGDNSGEINANGAIASLSVGDSIKGGTGKSSGAVLAGGSLDSVSVKNDVIGADSTASKSIDQSGFIGAKHIGSVAIGGSLIAGKKVTSSIIDSGAIRSGTDIGSIQIGGDLKGDSSNPAVIGAIGLANQSAKATQNLAINKVTIGGNMTWANILAGYSDNTSTVNGDAVNPDAQINSVVIGGNLTASNIVAGTNTGSDQYFGNSDDALIAAIYVAYPDLPSVIAKISSVRVIGAVEPSGAGNVSFGIVSQQVTAVDVHGLKIELSNANLAAGVPLGTHTGTTATSDGYEYHVLAV